MSTTHSWASSGPWMPAQGSSIPQAESSLETSPRCRAGSSGISACSKQC